MKNTLLKTLAVAVWISLANTAYSHHSFSATFDGEKFITINGEITDFKFRNPHVLIYLDVTNEDGSVSNWMAEGSSATGWRKFGWKADSLVEGEILRITGNETHDGSPMISIDEFALLDATGDQVLAELSASEDPQVAKGNTSATVESSASQDELFFIPTHLPTGEPNFTGITMQQEALIPGLGRGPDANDPPLPYNELGEAALAAVDLALDPQVFCDQVGGVRQSGYTPYGFKLNQHPDHITIEYEEYGTRRAVFFDDRLPKPGPRSEMGDSVARYEGDALIIETVNLKANFSGHRGRPLSEDARMTEVYTRIDNPEKGSIVQTETTIVDPKFLTEPWTIKRYKLYSNTYEFIENECVAPLRERPANVYQYTAFDQQFLD